MSSSTRRPVVRIALVALGLLTLAIPVVGACDKRGDAADEESQESKQTQERASEQTREENSREAPKRESGGTWRKVEESELDEGGEKMLAEAREARKKLGSRLKKALQGAVSESSFGGAVGFCQEAAPKLASEVSEEEGVEIGRTSHKLRNPENAPPEWAKETVEAKEADKYVFRGPEGELGYLHPIELGGLCVNCHGPRDKLSSKVTEMLEKHYPEDEATGFEVGDLRGWFWVEVPPSS